MLDAARAIVIVCFLLTYCFACTNCQFQPQTPTSPHNAVARQPPEPLLLRPPPLLLSHQVHPDGIRTLGRLIAHMSAHTQAVGLAATMLASHPSTLSHRGHILASVDQVGQDLAQWAAWVVSVVSVVSAVVPAVGLSTALDPSVAETLDHGDQVPGAQEHSLNGGVAQPVQQGM